MQYSKTRNFLLTFIIAILVFGVGSAQKIIPSKGQRTSFIEWNIGVAHFPQEDFFFPGTSVLLGKTFSFKENYFFEAEAGLAFPTILTGKLGIGKTLNGNKFSLGIRPFPMHYYLQTSFRERSRGYWIVSLEYNPHESIESFFVNKSILINFGYRWRF